MVLQSYVAGRQARDLQAVKAVLDPNIDQLTSRGEWRRGIEAATAGMKRSSSNNPGNRSLEVESVRFLRPDVALADARYTIKGTDGPDRMLWSSFTLIKALMENGASLPYEIRNRRTEPTWFSIEVHISLRPFFSLCDLWKSALFSQQRLSS